MKRKSTYDIAIVGGGVSGIYTAWRLIQSDPNLSPILKKWANGEKLTIAVFEGSDRIGGRLMSAKAPGMPDITCEIGGMRYVSPSQNIIKSLVENELKLERVEQVVYAPKNLVYARGERFNVDQLGDPEVLPYRLRENEVEWLKDPDAKNTADNFMGWAIEQILPGIKGKSGKELEEFVATATVDGKPLYEYGFWNLVAKSISNEAYEIAKTTVGYDSLGMNANALDSIVEYFNFTPDVVYYLLKDGYDVVPWTLQSQFTKAGGEVHMNTWMKGFDKCTLEDGSEGVELTFMDEGPNVQARAIVLAMPKRSIELLDQSSSVLKDSNMKRMMNSVQAVDLYKMFIAYDEAWWTKNDPNLKAGRSLTDLPLRQCYYWGDESVSGKNPDNTNAVIMAYNDMLSSTFWGGLRFAPLGPDDSIKWTSPGNKRFSSNALKNRRQFFKRGAMKHHDDSQLDEWSKQLRKNWDNHEAPAEMVDAMHKQLVELHNADIKTTPKPIEAAFMDWSDDPYGGAVHFWNSGYESSKVLYDMTKPVEDVNCFVCGEAFSTNQTWVEGALQTAEIVLQDRLGLPKPSWLNPEP